MVRSAKSKGPPVWWPFRRQGRAAGGLRLLRNPLGFGAVVFIAGSALERVLSCVHDEPPLVVLLLAPERVERDGNVFLAGTEKTTNADNEGVHATFLVNEYIDDLADLVVRRIVHALLVIVGHGP